MKKSQNIALNQSVEVKSGGGEENLQSILHRINDPAMADAFDVQSQSQKLDELEQMAMDVLEDI